MAVELSYVRRLKDELDDSYRQRHYEFTQLRKFWHGKYWEQVDSSSHGIGSLFKDARRGQADVGPDLKLVHNVLQEVCVKYQTYLSPLPMIRVPTDNPESTRAKSQATLKERALYGLWAEASMTTVFTKLGWYLPLFGHAFIGNMPDLDQNIIRPVLRSPENAYPIPSADPNGISGVIFCWKMRESAIKRDYPDYNPDLARTRKKGVRGQDPDPELELLEFWDGNEFARWAGNQKLNGVEHGYGFNLMKQVKFIDVPDEVWGHGAVEQTVSMVEMGNALGSLNFEAALQSVYPPLVLVNPQKFSETLPTGAGAVIAVNEGGSANYLTPPAGGLLAHAQLGNELERMIKQASSMPEVNFGNFAASIVTGKAINELQGAGTGSLVEMIQGAGLGPALTAWNEHSLFMLKRMFENEQIFLQGVRPRSITDMKPQEFNVKFRGKELSGSFRNEVVFSPYIGLHEKLVMNLQAMGAKLVSREFARDQIGIPDSAAMDEAIFTEAIDDAVLGAIAQAMLEPSPQEAAKVQGQAGAYIEGQPVALPSPAAHPLLGPAPAGGGTVSAPPLQLPAGSPQPAQVGAPSGVAPAPAAAPSGGVTLDQAQAALSKAPLQGKAFLVGEIVAKGSTTDAVEVAVTDEADKQPLSDAAAGFPVTFTSVAGDPTEPFVEIGSGRTGGEAPSADQLLAA